MSAPALAVHGLHAYYGESHVLQGIDLEVAPREAVSLIGRNGAGKTTTIAAIAGFLRPRSGSVHVNGTDLTAAPAHQVARAGVALVPQGRRIFGDLTVGENIGLATKVGQRVLVMNKGTIVFAGTPAELAAHRDVETRYLGV